MAKGFKELISEARARIREIDPAGAAEVLARDDGTLFLDVREAHEYEAGHLPGAHLVPRGMLEPCAAADSPAQDEELSDRGRPIVVYCGSGARSALAAVTLQELGFGHVLSMAGGIQAWEAEGRPLQR